MTTPMQTRLRTCAKHTGLDSVIELLTEAADEIDALQARAQVQGDPSWWMRETDEGVEWTDTAPLVLSGWTPFYKHPPASQPAEGGEVCNVKSSAGLIRPGKVDAWVANHYTTPPASHTQAQQPKPQPMTDEVFDLVCKAIDKADTITMEGDYMLDSDDCIAVVRVMQVLLSIRHGITSDKEA